MVDSSPALSFFRRIQTIAKLFRFVELCILLALLAWLSTRLPFAVRISGEYVRRFAGIILSPAATFLVGNAIFVTLVVKSGLFSPATSASMDNAVVNLFEKLRSDVADDQIAQEIVYQDKEMISDDLNKKNVIPISNNEEEVGKLCFTIPEVKACYRRSHSENLRRDDTDEEMKTNLKSLRRSETDICRKDFPDGHEKMPEEDDDVSNEDFQRTIEDFIARQVRFHRKERLAVVLHGQA